MVTMFLFYPLMKWEMLLMIFFWIQILRHFIMYHLLLYTLDIWHFYLSQFTSIHCDSMCFYLFIYPLTYVVLIYVFYCAIFTCKLCANKDIYHWDNGFKDALKCHCCSKSIGMSQIIKDFVLLSNMVMESEDDMFQVNLNNVMHFALH